jgi:putative cell wall-binding protein
LCIGKAESYSKLWAVVKMLLVLSHGQATVERGFSTNKQVETDNLYEESVIAKRTICDYVAYVGGIDNVDVTERKLILAAAAARQKYSAYLIKLQKQKTNDEQSQKRKALHVELEQLKTKKQRLQTDADALEAQADELAVKAEEKHDLTLIAQSNSLRKTAKQKLSDIATVDLQLENIQQQCRDK